ncbi:hypothetical protein QJS66_19450 [Kocuria rhizophila]|nr:hypothetical protein QJS66_19450 [Kocuria rhizophila]
MYHVVRVPAAGTVTAGGLVRGREPQDRPRALIALWWGAIQLVAGPGQHKHE